MAFQKQLNKNKTNLKKNNHIGCGFMAQKVVFAPVGVAVPGDSSTLLLPDMAATIPLGLHACLHVLHKYHNVVH